MADWYYAKGSKQFGPISIEQLREMASAGGLSPGDMVWNQAMSKWASAASVPGLFDSAVLHANVAPAGGDIGYYNPLDMPPRTVQNLRGYARPTGNVGEWPLDDRQVMEWDMTMQLRKKITSAASLYRLFFLLGAISSAILAIVLPVQILIDGRMPRGAGLSFGVTIAISGAFTALYFFAWKATYRCHRWAPLTMMILYVCGIAFTAISCVTASSSNVRGDPGAIAVSSTIMMLIVGAFAFISWRAHAAIPQYLATPAWCQEIIAKAKI